MIIYKIENKINDKIYIGQTKKKLSERIAQHIAENRFYFQKALNKYGLESFVISIIDEAYTKEILDEKEKYWIKFYDCRMPSGYNLTSGGEGNDSPTSEATRLKLSKAHLGKPSGMLGKHHSEESIQKMKKPCTEERKQKLKGRHHSEETKQKKRKPISEETRKNRLGRHQSEETKQKRSQSLKRRYETIPWNKGLPAWNKGRTGVYSEETLQKMRKPHKRKRELD